MSERPTREECIKWIKTQAIFANMSAGKGEDTFVKATIIALSEATIHYLTESATPSLYDEEPE